MGYRRSLKNKSNGGLNHVFPGYWSVKPLIGVTPDFNPGTRGQDVGGREPTYFLRARYVQAIEDLGGIPVILPLTADGDIQDRLVGQLDGLLLTGSGPDLPPALYGERKRFSFETMSRQRYEFELAMGRRAAAGGLPLLGICGGMQAMNVALGGTLLQDIPGQVTDAVTHKHARGKNRLVHTVRVASGTLLRRIVRGEKVQVNSSHHQAVKDLPPSLIASATSTDGVIEALEAVDGQHPFLVGVQWHPEFLYDRGTIHRRLFQAFIKAAKTHA